MYLRTDELLGRMREAAAAVARPVRFMEVCGTHTHAIGRAGLRAVFPDNITLTSGPGCPVCVTSQRDVERMLHLARTVAPSNSFVGVSKESVTICTFGDMIRVPGLTSSLERERSAGADVRVVYSPLDALDLAYREPEREVVFLGVGFETTAPGVAAVVLRAHALGLKNFSVYVSHKLIVPAMDAVLTGGSRIDGFITPGHVSIVIGAEAYEGLVQKYKMPCVVTGFEPSDVIEGVTMVLEQFVEGRAESEVQYTRAVRPGGNQTAWNTILRAFDVADAEWRGLGMIPNSGLKLKPELRAFDAAVRYELPELESVEPSGCQCGDVLRGMMEPQECALFGKVCAPRNPLGPCMVSSEGPCAARYRYG